ncbi:MAG: glycosyltransferase family 4 protein [Desulfobacula sp.]|nr:glycosyltransferase family 4 protein [Desulfobacula sp.]
MKTLIINSYDREGGAARAAYRLHKGLQSIGLDSQMLVQTKSSDDHTVIGPQTKIQKGFSMIRPTLDALPLQLYQKRNDVLFSPAILPNNMATKVADLDSDIINLHWVAGGFLKPKTLKHFNKPLIWTLHDMWPFTGGCHYDEGCGRYQESCGKCPILKSSKNKDLSRWIWQRKEKAWKDLDVVIVTPSYWLANCAKNSSLFRDFRVEVIPNGLDLNRFKPFDKYTSRELLLLPQDKKLVLFDAINSTSDKRKGFQYLKSTMWSLATNGWVNKAEVVIFGSSEPRNRPKFGLTTQYLGHLPGDISLALLYAAADVMVVPSIQEAFGQTASEAMACGTPVVAFRSTGLLDIVEHKQTGYLASPFDTEDLAKGIMWVLEDDERWRELSHQSIQKAEKDFDILNIAKKYVDLYKGIQE